MQFCSKCGTALTPTKKEDRIVLKCLKCGHEVEKAEKAISRIKPEKEKIIVIGRDEEKIRTLPKARIICPKCGNQEAFYWMVQTRGADESTTQFFRCSKCGYTWRESS
ncbi:TPA: transcription factor S [Candidatus Bathyarchaeota archaeon]|nr:transcription factor S [Candidatus Bathyarchaeota archaeon]